MALPLVFAFTLLAGAPSPEGTVAATDVWVVEGRVSNTPHSHPIQPSKGQNIFYVDTVSEGQVVAYFAEKGPPVGAWARFSGTALRFETRSPKPGSKKTFPVKQLTVETIERLPVCDAVQALLGKTEKKDSPELRAAIEKAGKDAFPVLIANLPDSRGGHINWAAFWLEHRSDSFDAIRGELPGLVGEVLAPR